MSARAVLAVGSAIRAAALFGAFSLVLPAGCSPVGPAEANPPNILFILADDLRWDALGAYENDLIRTPNLDALAEEGLVFDAYLVANPVCSASRAAYLSGLYTFQRGILRPGFTTHIAEGTPTAATLLGAAGYATGFIGKAHLGGDPRRWGFREVPFHYPGAQVGDPPEVWQTFYEDGQKVIIEGDVTPRMADAAIRFIGGHRRDRWFLWLATTAPHYPVHYNEEHPYTPGGIKRPPGYPPNERLGMREEWADYYSQIGTLDEQIGRVLASLDELGLRDDTLVFFTSDNGLMMLSHGILGKGVWYEEVVRQPAIARWPGRVEPGTRSDALLSSVDFLPTLLDIVGLEPPAALEGRSFLPVLEGGAGAREQAFSESVAPRRVGGGTWQMVRHGKFKLVQFTDRDEEHLYDLQADPHEQHDLANAPEYAADAEPLRARLRRWRETTL